MTRYMLTRTQYKRIKKMDHAQMSDWMHKFAATYYEKVKDKIKDDTVEIISRDYDITEKNDGSYISYEESVKYIKQALESVKGIGEKRASEFLKIYDELLDKAMKQNSKKDL